MTRVKSDTLYGTLNVLILKTLATEPMHGLAITRKLSQTTEDFLKVDEGALYPALHRLEKAGYLKAQWGVSDQNRRARFYAITEEGKHHLASEVANWARHAEVVSRVLDAGLAR